MKKKSLLLLTIFFSSSILFAQPETFPPLTPISAVDLARLKSIPELPVTDFASRSILLPAMVDNSTQPYFRPLFQQVGLECGQASSIGLGFTYEIDNARNVAANTTANQYPTHFAYNFINNGTDNGVSYFETFEILKRCGTPNVADYGGMSYGGPSRWISGYAKYYNGMQNRITDVYSIKVNTYEGLEMLKSWIYNHLGNSTVGGVANFYTQYMNPTLQLPAGTPESGKYVITSWGGSPNHGLTIVGYNDSIRWDYNNDGLYTNNIDINGDGIVNLKDCEIGGVKVANTYGGINNWGNTGFCYMMYKTFAENLGNGGIWNNIVTIIYAKPVCTPKLTYKITLKHTSRTKIKVSAGVSTDISATEPDAILNLPIFDFQGGDKYMQGGTTEADKTLEFGLDATPLLSEIASGQPAKFFLMVQEADPDNLATGQIIDWQIIDYNNGGNAIACNSIPAFVENGVTTATINTTLNFNLPVITNTSLPVANINEPYSVQMYVSGGTAPYKWKNAHTYSEDYSTVTFPMVSDAHLTPTNTSYGYAAKEIPFSFPFYGKNYNKVYMHVDGYLMFEENDFPWTFIIYEKTFFKNTRHIAPYMCKPIMTSNSGAEGFWYSGCADSVTFRWKEYLYNAQGSTNLNYAVSLFPSGKIVFYYGTVQGQSWVKWNAGISNGDGVNFHFAAITDSLSQPTENTKIEFEPSPFPIEMNISENGIFSGTPVNGYQNYPVKFYVNDNNFLYDIKELNFATKGVKINYIVHAGNDSIIDFGESVTLDAVLQNIGTDAINNLSLSVSNTGSFINLTDSTQNIGNMTSGQIITIPNAIAFNVSQEIPDSYVVRLHNKLTCTGDLFENNSSFIAHAPVLEVAGFTVYDGNNGILQPGETATVGVLIKNSGGSRANYVEGILLSYDPFFQVTQPAASTGFILPDSSVLFYFGIHVLPSCPVTHLAFCNLNLFADQNYSNADSVFFNVGGIIEDYETGNFQKYPWRFFGETAWTINQASPFEGDYCAKSGTVTHNQQSAMYLQKEVLSASLISFYCKVSSEPNYDFLIFYIDGQEQGRWAGEMDWTLKSYPVKAGLHTFLWTYKKDVSQNVGQDCAWLDYINFPVLSDYLLVVNAGNDITRCSNDPVELNGMVMGTSDFLWTTTGDGTFSNAQILNTIYTPGSQDMQNGGASLVLVGNKPLCPTTSDTLTLSAHYAPGVFAGTNDAICASEVFINNSSTASAYESLMWTTSGDGHFDNPQQLHPIYVPGTGDISLGQVTLSVAASGYGNCPDTTDALLLYIYPNIAVVAGEDQTISYGSSTLLTSIVSGGSGNFTYNWQPADQLVDNTVAQPVTINLTSSIQFTVNVTDIFSGCISSDAVIVYVSGGPLSVNTNAQPDTVCLGSSSQLNALAGGGTGNYSCIWTSVPQGFTSTLFNPVVTPLQTTIYTAEINDGSTTLTSSVTVTVSEAPGIPYIPAGPIQVDIYYTPTSIYTTYSVANAENYVWQLSPEQAGILMVRDTLCEVTWDNYFTGQAMLKVSTANQCGNSNWSEVLLINTENSVGIFPHVVSDEWLVFPNPTQGQIFISTTSASVGSVLYRLTDLRGITLQHGYFTSPKKGDIFTLDATDLPGGLYLLYLRDNKTERHFSILISQ
jgi:hypothetical protein